MMSLSPMKLSGLVCTLVLLAIPCLADTVDLGTHGKAEIPVPKGWRLSATKQEDAGIVCVLTPPEGINAQGVISFAFTPAGESTSKGQVDEKTLAAADNYVDHSVEKKKNLKHFDLTGDAYGSYCYFTDATLVGQPSTKGEFKALATGIIWFSPDVSAVVMLLADDDLGADYKSLIKAVSGVKITPAK